MKNTATGLALLFLLTLPAQAQEQPPFEIFSGFSWLNSEGDQFFGWQSDLTFNFKSRYGFTADFSGQYGRVTVPGVGRFDVAEYQYLFGPRIAARGEKFTGFVHGLVGFAQISVGGGSASGLALGLGGGLDWNIGDQYALRIFQIDYVPAKISGIWGHQSRLGVGFVLKPGGP